jgi:hypothetical protein
MQSNVVSARVDALSDLAKHFDTSGKSLALFYHPGLINPDGTARTAFAKHDGYRFAPPILRAEASGPHDFAARFGTARQHADVESEILPVGLICRRLGNTTLCQQITPCASRPRRSGRCATCLAARGPETPRASARAVPPGSPTSERRVLHRVRWRDRHPS